MPRPIRRFLTTQHIAARLVRLYLGLLGCGLAIGLSLRSGLGVSPWDVLAQGIARSSGTSFGTATILISIVVLLLWIPLGQKPGVGTISNALLVGCFVDLSLVVVPATDAQSLWGPFVQAVLLLAGTILFPFASALYIGANLKPGPRDGLMTGLVARTGRRIWTVRTLLEVSVTALGWLLGGTPGIGTVIFAVSVGPLIQLALRLFSVNIGQREDNMSEHLLVAQVPPAKS
ncbi:membrane protein YczE [Arthrobacter sp. B1I2]|uniref:membrane protein YczE n=1 Tax=Arthrobacter sp. B1I2 TaxID=3042263 RepID=UPI003F8D3985